MLKYKMIIFAMTLFSLNTLAQKISLGSCTIREDDFVGEYKGEMLNGKPYGKGVTIYQNGNKYEGEYVRGRRQGEGTFTFADGERYEGSWVNGHQHGHGTYYFLNNNKYVGLWYRD